MRPLHSRLDICRDSHLRCTCEAIVCVHGLIAFNILSSIRNDVGTGLEAAEKPEGGRKSKRRKGKRTPPTSEQDVCSLPGLAHAALSAVLCTLAACAVASRLAVSSSAEGNTSHAERDEDVPCSQVALSLLAWLHLPEKALSGMPLQPMFPTILSRF